MSLNGTQLPHVVGDDGDKRPKSSGAVMIELGTSSNVKISSEVQQLLDQINEEKEKFDKLRPFDRDTEQRIKLAFLPDRVTASLNMEGIIATRRQTLAIMDGMTVDENSARTEQEILNALRADEHTFDEAQDSARLTEIFIREINRLIEDKTGECPGEYRPRDVQISQAAFVPPSHLQVPQLVHELVESFNAAEEPHPVIRAAWLHNRFTYIHPFLDGNGRTGRLLQDFALLQGNLFPTGIPSSIRDDYYDALAAADRDEWDQLVQIIALRQLSVISRASGIAQERRQRSTWIGEIARRAGAKKAGSQHKNFLVWSHKMNEIRAAFEDTARELSETSDLIQIRHETFDSIDFPKWQEVCRHGQAARTWSFSQTFFVDGTPVFRGIFYFKGHRHLLDDAFGDARDAVSLFLTGGNLGEEYNFFRFEDSLIRLREILFLHEDMHVYYFQGEHLEGSRGGERWSPANLTSVSEIVRDFYEDVLHRKAGI